MSGRSAGSGRGGISALLARAFPERQILLRQNDAIRCWTLSPRLQLGVTLAFLASLGWLAAANIAYFSSQRQQAGRDAEMSVKLAELEIQRTGYEAAFRHLDRFQGLFGDATCEISDIQDSLSRLAERSMRGDKRTSLDPLPRLEIDAAGCRSAGEGTSAAAVIDDNQAVGRNLAKLQQTLDGLRASHGAFLSHTANVAAIRLSQLETALRDVGVDLGTVRDPGSDQARPRFGRGGPFVPPDRSSQLEIAPVALYNRNAAQLDRLNHAARILPLGEPLEDYELTSPFGARNDPINFRTGIHEGIDLGAPEGTPIRATGDGTVVWAGPRERYGNLVEIDHGMGVRTRYAHLSRLLVRADQHVTRATVIGLVGSTGRSTGPHLHYEVRVADRPTNPLKFILAGNNVFKGK